MRYLAILLLAPWLLILCWGYWTYPKSLPRVVARRVFDVAVVVLALIAAAQCAVIAFDRVALPVVDGFGPASGAIWQQVLPALYGYGAFTTVVLLAMLLRHVLWGRRR
ncbi:putative copper export protein [Rhodanobacter sp. TND4EL1]